MRSILPEARPSSFFVDVITRAAALVVLFGPATLGFVIGWRSGVVVLLGAALGTILGDVAAAAFGDAVARAIDPLALPYTRSFGLGMGVVANLIVAPGAIIVGGAVGRFARRFRPKRG